MSDYYWTQRRDALYAAFVARETERVIGEARDGDADE